MESYSRNIQLSIQYDGSHYHGWQFQKDLPTIQGIIESRIKHIVKHPVTLHASGRTDAGVHALSQTANFKTSNPIPCLNLALRLNSLLPPDIKINSAQDRPLDFESRTCSKARLYRYYIWNCRFASPFLARYSWQIFSPLLLEEMWQASRCLLGEQDFSSFRSAECESLSTFRKVEFIEIQKRSSHLVSIEIQANAFLHNMVRIIIGTLVDVGLGRIPSNYLKEILAAKDRRIASQTAPPQGLFFVKTIF